MAFVALLRIPATARPALLALLVLVILLFRAPATGLGGGAGPNFVQGTLNTTIGSPTSLAFGPDGRLYVASLEDGIRALTLDPITQQVLSTEQIASGLALVLGIAFDPTAPASPVVVYASHQQFSATNGFEGVVSKFTAPNWDRVDVITGLPTSGPCSNHYTNGLAFDDTGRLFIAQGSSTDSGIRQSCGIPSGLSWPETPLSSAILYTTLPIDDQAFDGTITYNPSGPPADDNVAQTGGDVSVYAAGLRNPYDLVIHSNGKIYATDNGPVGPDVSTSCSESGSGVSFSDELNLIEQGNYYGHPNRNRGLGLPDARQCVYHPGEEASGGGYTEPIAVLPEHCSCDGIAEYTNAAFGGAMQGDLVIARFNMGTIMRVVLSPDGSSMVSTSLLESEPENPFEFSGPLDVAVGPDGTIYIAELGDDAIGYLAPDTDRDGCADSRELGSSAVLGGRRDANYFWDFFDTPTGSPPARDRVVTIADIGAVVARFGTTGSPAIDPLSAPPASGYHTAFDRSPPQPGADPWDLGPPDGSVTIGDIGLAVAQFGHSCLG